QAKDIGEYPDSVVPSSAQIKNGNGQDVTTNYNITYTSGKLTITSVKAPLTVNYVYAKGGEAAETHTEDVEIFTDYSVNSPEITGYTPDKETVEGTMENLDGVTETVTYTAIEYTAKFVDENGETVEKVKFTVEDDSIDEPAVPEKAGYAGEWEEYTLGTSDITIKPVYANITSIQLENYEESSETGYKEDKTFTVKADDLPEGAEIHWFLNGEDVGTGESYTVEDPTEDYNIYAAVVDADGNILDETLVQAVKVRNGFFDRLKAFFADLIEKILGKAIADLLTSIC
ncbi:MAG: MucBP domain-containing protein, partial [Clostridia bacterium]|nr:MucBP domain-containing protein [Clostridia bacterium]